jgi:hypothetical protein
MINSLFILLLYLFFINMIQIIENLLFCLYHLIVNMKLNRLKKVLNFYLFIIWFENKLKLISRKDLISYSISAIHDLYSPLSNSTNESMTIEHIFPTQRLNRLFTYWEKNLIKFPNKLLIPVQHSLDYSLYYSIRFCDEYRITLERYYGSNEMFIFISDLFSYSSTWWTIWEYTWFQISYWCS